jgi:hypothetical protein
MSSPNELKAQLARAEQALLEAEKEIDRQRKAAAEAAAAADENIPEGAKALIAAVSRVDLPAFWDADPVLWFRQCESAFRRAGTVSSGVKFDHVVGKLPNAVSLSCSSLLLSINVEDKDAYERLTDHLCKNYSKSKWHHPALGDRRPSQLLQDMRALLPDKEVEGVLFQCLFLKRLPTTMSDAVMAAGLENIEDMAPWLTACTTSPPPPASPPSLRSLPAVHTCQPSTASRGNSTALTALQTALAALQTALAARWTAGQPRPGPERTKRISLPSTPPGGPQASG